MTDHVQDFIDCLRAPKLMLKPGVEPEADDAFRRRILSVVPRAKIHTLSGERLDAIGKINGLIRKGFMEIEP